MQTSRCTPFCAHPCAKDHRTKAEKIAAMRAGATTPGERAAADAALRRTKPAPSDGLRGVLGKKCDHGYALDQRCPTCTAYRPPRGQEARAAGRQAFTKAFMEPYQREILRKSGFTMPGDPGFDTEFTARAADANEAFAKAREAMRQNNEDYAEALRRHFADAKMTPEQRAQFNALVGSGRARFYSYHDLARILGLEQS